MHAPQAVAEAVRSREMVRCAGEDGVLWQVVPAAVGSSRITLIASGGPDTGQEHLLKALADSLELGWREAEAASDLTRELAHAWDRLSFFYELTQVAGDLSSPPDLFRATARLLHQVVDAEDVFLASEREAGWTAQTASGLRLNLPKEIVQPLREAARPLSLAELPSIEDPEWLGFGLRDLLVAPIYMESDFYGVVGLLNPPEGRFDSNDLQLLAAVADQVGALAELALSRQSRESRLRFEHELAIAAEIQESLLPVELPDLAGVEIAAFLRLASRVGGDFYDIARTRDDDIMLLLTDVAGKGVPAALLTSLVHATFQGESAHHTDPADLLEVMNQLLFADLDKAASFVTGIVGRLSTNPLRFEYASAGHVEAALWLAGENRLEFLPATGFPLGIEKNARFETQRRKLHPGDVLLLYSDGVTESEAPDGKVLGKQGLADIMHAVHPAHASDQLRTYVDALDVHRQEAPLRDDVALLLVRALEVDSEPQMVVPFVLAAEMAHASRLVDPTRMLVKELELPQDAGRQLADGFALALTEVVTNQMEHAYAGGPGRIQGRLVLDRNSLTAHLYDYGIAFDAGETSPKSAIDPSDPPERGYGMRLARALTDELIYERLDGGRNHWCLRKYLSGEHRHED